MQLIGWHSWEQSAEAEISVADVSAAAVPALYQLGEAVLQPVTRRLSGEQRRFLAAMAVDAGPSRMQQLGERLGRTSGSLNVYRTRLLNSGVITQVARGQVDFAIPGLRAAMRQSDEFRQLSGRRRRQPSQGPKPPT